MCEALQGSSPYLISDVKIMPKPRPSSPEEVQRSKRNQKHAEALAILLERKAKNQGLKNKESMGLVVEPRLRKTTKRVIDFPIGESIGEVGVVRKGSPFSPFYIDFADLSFRYTKDDLDAAKENTFYDHTGRLVVNNDDIVSLAVYDDDRLPLLELLVPESIDSLYIGRSVTVSEVPYFRHLSGLKYLGLSGHSGTDATLQNAAGLHSLTQFVARDSGGITDRGLYYLSPNAPLTHLSLIGTSITGEFLSDFPHNKSLQFLVITGSELLTEKTVACFQGLHSLVSLRLDLAGLTTKAMSYLASLDALESLTVWGSAVSDEGVEQLSSLHKLTYLDVQGPMMTDQSIPVLASLHSLKMLLFAENQMSESGKRDLIAALPNCEISF
jgi:hypothetical protein